VIAILGEVVMKGNPVLEVGEVLIPAVVEVEWFPEKLVLD